MSVPFNAVYKVRGLIMLPPCLFELVVIYREAPWDAVVWPVGLALFFVGMAMRVWAQIHLHYRLRTRKTLTTTGPYALVRNPIYIANTLILLAMTVMSELLWFIPVKLLWCAVVYSLVVRREEAHLSDKYGAPYQAYMETIPRWVPRLGAWANAGGGQRRFLLPSIVAELHCFLLVIPVVFKEIYTHVIL